MSKQLQSMLQVLQNRGNTALGQEVAAFLDAVTSSLSNNDDDEVKAKNTSSPIPQKEPQEERRQVDARKLLAQAAKTLREGRTRDDIVTAHDFIGAAVEVYRDVQAGVPPSLPDTVTASLGRELASEHAFQTVEKVTIMDGDSPDFEGSSEQLVTAMARLLLDAGYTDEARKYLTEYNSMIDERNTQVATKSTKSTLKDLQAQYRKNGDLVRARALEEVICDLGKDDDETDDECDSAKKLDLPVDDESQAGEDETEDEGREMRAGMQRRVPGAQKEDQTGDRERAAEGNI